MQGQHERTLDEPGVLAGTCIYFSYVSRLALMWGCIGVAGLQDHLRSQVWVGSVYMSISDLSLLFLKCTLSPQQRGSFLLQHFLCKLNS